MERNEFVLLLLPLLFSVFFCFSSLLPNTLLFMNENCARHSRRSDSRVHDGAEIKGPVTFRFARSFIFFFFVYALFTSRVSREEMNPYKNLYVTGDEARVEAN